MPTKGKKEKLYKAQRGLCFYCGAEMRMTVTGGRADSFTMDHFVPIALGGRTCRFNLVAACKRCNSVKGDRMPNPVETRRYNTLKIQKRFDAPVVEGRDDD